MLRRVALVRSGISEKLSSLQEPHGVTSQKTPFFIATAVKTSNLTSLYKLEVNTENSSLSHVRRVHDHGDWDLTTEGHSRTCPPVTLFRSVIRDPPAFHCYLWQFADSLKVGSGRVGSGRVGSGRVESSVIH
jgi:hypothetical protein